MLLYLSFDVSAIYRDLQMAAASRSEKLFLNTLMWELASNSVYLLILALLVFLDCLENRAARPAWIDFRLLMLGFMTYIADILIRFTNAQVGAFPLAAVFALIVMNQITVRRRTLPASETPSTRASYAGVLSMGALLLLSQMVPDAAGITYGALRKAWPARPDSVVRFAEPRVASLLLYDGEPPERSNGSIYTTYVNEGVALLRKASAPGETILTMDMINPFPFVLAREPASGGIAAAAYGYTIDDDHHPSSQAYFGNAEVVMVPKRPSSDDQYFRGLYRIYEAELQSRYRLAAENDWWLLYRRR